MGTSKIAETKQRLQLILVKSCSSRSRIPHCWSQISWSFYTSYQDVYHSNWHPKSLLWTKWDKKKKKKHPQPPRPTILGRKCLPWWPCWCHHSPRPCNHRHGRLPKLRTYHSEYTLKTKTIKNWRPDLYRCDKFDISSSEIFRWLFLEPTGSTHFFRRLGHDFPIDASEHLLAVQGTARQAPAGLADLTTGCSWRLIWL